MAVFALNDCYIALNGTDRSSYIQSVTLTINVAELDATDMADAGWTVPIAGRKSGSLALTFNQSMTNGEIDSIMWGLIGTTTTFEIRASNSSLGINNPKYTGSVLINSWTPVDGSVSDLAQVSVTLPLSGAVTRATS